MFGKHKKEKEAKKLAAQQPVPVEPVEEFLEAEIIEDDDEGESIDMSQFDDLSAVTGGAKPAQEVEPAEELTETQDEEIIDIESIPAADVEEATIAETEETEEAEAIEEPETIQEEKLLPEIEEATEEPVEEEPAAEEVKDTAEEESEESEEAEDTEEESEEPVEEPAAPAEENNEEVVYVVDGPEEDDEIVKPAKLVKLPHLVDFLLNSDPKPSKKYLLKYSMMLTELYSKCDTPEDKAIVKSCVLKIANELRK